MLLITAFEIIFEKSTAGFHGVPLTQGVAHEQARDRNGGRERHKVKRGGVPGLFRHAELPQPQRCGYLPHESERSSRPPPPLDEGVRHPEHEHADPQKNEEQTDGHQLDRSC